MYSVFKIVYCIAALYICMYSMSQKNNPFNFPGFIEKKQWPPNSPDLNSLDYHFWGAMLEKYHKLQAPAKARDD